MTLFVYSLKETDSTWPCVCSVTDHRILQIYDKKIYGTHSTIVSCASCAIYWSFFCSYHCVTSLWLITEHTHGNMKFIERVNVKLRQPVNFRDRLKRKCRTENTLFEHVQNTSPIPNAEISRSGLVNCIRNKNSVLDAAMFIMNLRRKNYFDNLTNILHVTLKGEVPNF